MDELRRAPHWAHKVRLLRRMRQWSAEQLAQAAGLSVTVVACIETASGQVELADLEALARTSNLSMAELLVPPGRTPHERSLLAVLGEE
jgi:transcriptional regulator with XRE-family HTH domain